MRREDDGKHDLGMFLTPPRPSSPQSSPPSGQSGPGVIAEWHCRLLTFDSCVTLLNNQLGPRPSLFSSRPFTIRPLAHSVCRSTHSASFNTRNQTHLQAPHHVIPRRGRVLDGRQPAEPVHQACSGRQIPAKRPPCGQGPRWHREHAKSDGSPARCCRHTSPLASAAWC
jgi:hypothetical protein